MIGKLLSSIGIKKFSISWLMLVITVSVGLIIWFSSDRIQSNEFSKFFHAKLSDRFSIQAQEQRVLFDQYVKGHYQVANLLSRTSDLARYVNKYKGESFGGSDAPVNIYKDVPSWLSPLSVLSNFVQPRYILLYDRHNKLRDAYIGDDESFPAELGELNNKRIELSYQQSFLTMLNDRPYLIASESIVDENKALTATLTLASPLDGKFLITSQGAKGNSNIVALLTGDTPTILISSESDLLPAGMQLDGLGDRYLVTGQGFVDYATSDLNIEFASFISTGEVKKMTQEILDKDRKLKAFTALAYIASFSLLMFWITHRIQKLTQKVVEFSEHMDIQQPEYNSGDQIDILQSRFQYFANAIKEETEALEYQALHDTLTELPNRKCLNNRIQLEIIKGKLKQQKFSLILGDLNRFKEVNDTLGHHIGDMVLQQVSERLFHIFRKSDVVARLGGDEFGILLPNTSVDEAIGIIDKVEDAFEIPYVVGQHYFTLGISFGLVEYPVHGNDVNILLKRADIAMYSAKNINCLYTVYDFTNDPHSTGRLALTEDLRRAIENQNLEVYYQSKINIKANKVVSAEALLRWNHPERGYIPPDEFIPLAEQTGLIKPLTEWVIEQALSQGAAWKKEGIHLSMAVNISPCCLHDVQLPELVRAMIRKYNITPSDCILELTESAIMTNPMRAREVLTEIDAMGVIISIDDFGTGYSSLAYLKQLPVDELKIDRSFIKEMTKDGNDYAIVQATVSMAHNLGLKVVAEGVEDEETWDLLENLGCDVAQGFYKGKPMPAKEFLELVNSKVSA